MRNLLKLIAVAALALGAAGCNPDVFSEEEKKLIASLSLASLPPLPADPTNRVADDERAVALGAALFSDTDFSGNGAVSCATCHAADKQFQDGLPLARGIGTTDRRTMPLAGVAYSPWQFWDGRKDSLWAQALGPLEDAREHGGNRVSYARLIGEKYRDSYEDIFGPLPEFAALPANAGPKGNAEEKAAWEAMAEEDRRAVDRVFADLGKAIAAFERTITHLETRFDRFAAALAAGTTPKGDAAFTDLEAEGLKLFIGKGQCVNCHNGPRLTDDHFHNTGVPAVPGLPEDRGRAQAVQQVLSDPFNCEGAYSDAPDKCDELRFMIREGHELERAFKTPSLRGAAGRPPYMHSGQIATLEQVVDHYARAPEAPAGHSEIEPVALTEQERAGLIAFLKTLD